MGPPKRYIHILESIIVNLFGGEKRVFADALKFKTSNWDYTRLFGWELNLMTKILIGEKQREIWDREREKRRLYEDGGRDWSSAPTSQGMPGSTGNWDEQKLLPFRNTREEVALLTPWFWIFLVSRTTRE